MTQVIPFYPAKSAQTKKKQFLLSKNKQKSIKKNNKHKNNKQAKQATKRRTEKNSSDNSTIQKCCRIICLTNLHS